MEFATQVALSQRQLRRQRLPHRLHMGSDVRRVTPAFTPMSRSLSRRQSASAPYISAFGDAQRRHTLAGAGEKLTRSEAFDLVKRSVEALVSGAKNHDGQRRCVGRRMIFGTRTSDSLQWRQL